MLRFNLATRLTVWFGLSQWKELGQRGCLAVRRQNHFCLLIIWQSLLDGKTSWELGSSLTQSMRNSCPPGGD